jgi:N-ethylmaleimide reductase
MTRSRAIGGVPNSLMRDYYGQRASAGLIVTEGIAPSPNALGYARIPGLFSAAQTDGWRAVTARVHEAGGRILAQLMHTGRITHPHNLPSGARTLAPSAVGAGGTMYTDEAGPQAMPVPEVMTEADIRHARDEFVQAAKNALDAGFDGVELHGANGYLLEQFLHPHTNRREDAYGGSVEHRTRFVAEVVEACAEVLGPDRVAIRLSPFNTFNDLPVHAAVQAQYAALAARGLSRGGRRHPDGVRWADHAERRVRCRAGGGRAHRGASRPHLVRPPVHRQPRSRRPHEDRRAARRA